MCRQGMVSLNESEDITNFVEIASTYYGSTQKDGLGYAYSSLKDNRIVLKKTSLNAGSYWLLHPDKIDTSSVVFHTRIATNGSVSDSNSHPFYSKGITLTHNGVLSSYSKAKDRLIKEGARFTSNTDSEVLLHAYIRHGDDFIKALKEDGVTGYAAVQILEYPDIIKVYKTALSDYGLLISDNFIIGMSDSKIIPVESIESEKLYTIKYGRIIEKKDIGGLDRYMFYGKSKSYKTGNNYTCGSVIDTGTSYDYENDWESYMRLKAKDREWEGYNKETMMDYREWD